MIRPSLHHTDSERNLESMSKLALKRSLKDEYDADIARRKAASTKKKELEKAKDLLMLKMNDSYSPWGRGGGGAPLRDVTGDTISDLTQVYNAERLPVEAPLSPQGGNNKVQQKNILQDALIQRLEERHKSIREAFLASDRDRSGYLDAFEIRRLCKLYNLSTAQVNNVLECCDIDYNGMISYDEFCQTLVREDYPAGGSYSPKTTTLSPVRTHRTYSPSHSASTNTQPSAAARQQRQGNISPTTLSPPYLANLTGDRQPLGPSDDGGNTSPGGSPLWPKKMTTSSPKANMKGASFYVDAPRTPERLLQERKRKQLIADLDKQVNERSKKRNDAELAELRATLLSQQRLINQGLDHWGQPIPDGDPRGTARLMAVNTFQKLEDVGLSPNNREQDDRYGGRRPQIDDRGRNGVCGDGRGSARKPYENYSTGGGSGPSGGSSLPFMSSLASINGPSPEEKRRSERKRRQLQEDLANQVREQRVKNVDKKLIKMRETVKSRQRKIDGHLDNWGQHLPENDPFGVSRQMMSDQDKLRRQLNEEEMMLETLQIEVEKAAAGHDHSPSGKSREDDLELVRLVDEYDYRQPAMDEHGVDIINMMESPSRTSRRDVPSFESTPMGMNNVTISPSRDPVSFTQLPDASPGRTRQTDGGHHLGNRRAALQRQRDNEEQQRAINASSSATTSVDSIEYKLRDAIRKAMMTETAMRHLFVQFDKIGSGKISANDFQRGFQKLGIVDATKEEVDSLLRRLDYNGDGYIDYLEFVRIAVRGVRHQGAGRRKGPRRPAGRPKNMNRTKARSAARKGARRAAKRKPGQNTQARTLSRTEQHDLKELMNICKELMKEQQILKKSVRRTNKALGFPVPSSR
jgi:Ca2+-binding EF-hand superfamily protein